MHDVIVVGARCAGAPTAMLLARRGYRVLLVDRVRFPSDTVAGGGLQPAASAFLAKWGVLDRLLATGCPPLRTATFDAGEVSFTGTPPPADGIDYTLLVRRNVLDSLLVDAAVDAGVELRESFSVLEVSTDGERVTGVVGRTAAGSLVAERASVVIGADGWQSVVARGVDAPVYNELPSLSVNAYSYWSDLPFEGLGLFARPGRFVIAGQSHDGLTLVQSVIARQDEARFRADIDTAFAETVQSIAPLAEHFPTATRQERFRLVTHLPNGFRRPWGPGWALVGDAGYVKDPVTAQGMSDAFRDAELLAEAVDDALSGRAEERAAFSAYERRRNEAALPMYELTTRLAQVDLPPPDHLLEIVGAAAADQDKADRFFGAIAGTVPVDDVFPVAKPPRHRVRT